MQQRDVISPGLSGSGDFKRKLMIITGIRHQGGIHSYPLDWDKAMEIYDLLMDDPEENYQRLFCYSFGLFTGARASEIASIKWENIYGINETARGRKDLRIVFDAKKGSERRYPYMAPELVNAIIRVKEWAPAECVKSQLPVITARGSRRREAINVDASALVNSAMMLGEVYDNRGCHALRKTIGRRLYELHGKDDQALHFVQKFLGHRSLNSTLSYIGITEEKVRDAIQNLNPGSDKESYLERLDRFSYGDERPRVDKGNRGIPFVLHIPGPGWYSDNQERPHGHLAGGQE